MKTKKLFIPLCILISTLLFVGCSKDEEEQTTTFEGSVVLSDANKSFEGLRVVIYGRNNCNILGCDLSVRKTVAVGSDGTFSIQYTSGPDTYFLDRYYTIDVWDETKLGIMNNCTPDCYRLDPGGTYSPLRLFVDR